jgi:hypothetical protein
MLIGILSSQPMHKAGIIRMETNESTDRIQTALSMDNISWEFGVKRMLFTTPASKKENPVKSTPKTRQTGQTWAKELLLQL